MTYFLGSDRPALQCRMVAKPGLAAFDRGGERLGQAATKRSRTGPLRGAARPV
jgi:energy-converting hydrogenase Eha subunit F